MYRQRPRYTEQKSGLRSPKVTHFQVLVCRGGAGKAERKDRKLEPDMLPIYLSFKICSANKLVFKAARLQEHLGVGVWGTFIPDGKKGGTLNFSLLCFYPDGGL